MTLRCFLLCLLSGMMVGCGSEAPPVGGEAAPPVAISEPAAHGYLGVQLADPQAVPLVISGFVPGSPAESSGLQPGDAILRVGRQWDPTGEQLMGVLQSFQPDDVVGVRVQRERNELEYQVILISAESVESSMQGTTR